MTGEWRKRVVADAATHHGEPCIRGTRIPVTTIVASLADGMTPDEIIAEYPQLEREDVLAALAYAADVLREQALLPFPLETT